MTKTEKNQFLLILIGQIKRENSFNKPYHVNIAKGNKNSVVDYFELFSELASMGHVTNIFIVGDTNPNRDIIDIININLKESIEAFMQVGGFRD
jgi:hypothetical protein